MKLMIFLIKRLLAVSIKTLQQSLTSYKFFFMNLVQANTNHVLLHMIYLLAPDSKKKYLFEVKFCCNVLIEDSGRRLVQEIVNPRKMLTSVKLIYSYGRS